MASLGYAVPGAVIVVGLLMPMAWLQSIWPGLPIAAWTTTTLLGLLWAYSVRFSAVALVASLLWLPASALLAGNLALNFSGARGTVWLAGSVVVIVAALASLGWALAGCAAGRFRRP